MSDDIPRSDHERDRDRDRERERNRDRDRDRDREGDQDRDRERENNRERGREERDRDISFPRDYYERPTAISLFLRLGYDIRDNDDVQRLASDLRWAAEKRRFDVEQKPHQTALLFTGLISVISIALTVLGQWIVAKFTGK